MTLSPSGDMTGFPCEEFDGKDSHLKCWEQLCGQLSYEFWKQGREVIESRGSNSERRGEKRVGAQTRNYSYLIKWEKQEDEPVYPCVFLQKGK